VYELSVSAHMAFIAHGDGVTSQNAELQLFPSGESLKLAGQSHFFPLLAVVKLTGHAQEKDPGLGVQVATGSQSAVPSPHSSASTQSLLFPLGDVYPVSPRAGVARRRVGAHRVRAAHVSGRLTVDDGSAGRAVPHVAHRAGAHGGAVADATGGVWIAGGEAHGSPASGPPSAPPSIPPSVPPSADSQPSMSGVSFCPAGQRH